MGADFYTNIIIQTITWICSTVLFHFINRYIPIRKNIKNKCKPQAFYVATFVGTLIGVFLIIQLSNYFVIDTKIAIIVGNILVGFYAYLLSFRKDEYSLRDAFKKNVTK